MIGLFLFWREADQIAHYPPTAWEISLPQSDCAVVLTGGPGRIKEGLDLLSRGIVKKLIISGVYPNSKLREVLPTLPFFGNVNEEDIILERRSTTTYGNAQQSLPIVEALRCRDITLITSHIHMHRSYQTFRAAFPEKMTIYPHAIVAGRLNPDLGEVVEESFKSLFYALWAYGLFSF